MNKTEACVALRQHATHVSREERWSDGEGEYYGECYKQVAQILEQNNLPEDATFEVESGVLKLVLSPTWKIALFDLFEDTFRGRPWDCKEYCYEHIHAYHSLLFKIEFRKAE